MSLHIDQTIAYIDGMSEEDLAIVGGAIRERLTELRNADPYEYFIVRVLPNNIGAQYLSNSPGIGKRQWLAKEPDDPCCRIFRSWKLADSVRKWIEKDPRGGRYYVGKQLKNRKPRLTLAAS